MNFDIYTKELLTLDIGLNKDVLGVIASYTREYIDTRYIKGYFDLRDFVTEDPTNMIIEVVGETGMSKYLFQCIDEPFNDHSSDHGTVTENASQRVEERILRSGHTCPLSRSLHPDDHVDLGEARKNGKDFVKRLQDYKVVSDEVNFIIGTLNIHHDKLDSEIRSIGADTPLGHSCPISFKVNKPITVESIILAIREALCIRWCKMKKIINPSDVDLDSFGDFLIDIVQNKLVRNMNIKKNVFSDGVLHLDMDLDKE